MAQAFGKLPSGTLKTPEPFTLRVPDRDVDDFKQLLELSKIGPETWYNRQEDGRFGISRDWLVRAKQAWLRLDWRRQEERINSFPNFKASVASAELGGGGGGSVDIHFAALFSRRPDAVPLVLLHGWPGSFLEFLPLLDLLVAKHSPDSLPYHVVVPSLPGYGPSSDSLPPHLEPTLAAVAASLHQLMLDLGFARGYVAQGGDVGSFLARIMSSYHECKAFHVNLLTPDPEKHIGSIDELQPHELEHLQRSEAWLASGTSYQQQHYRRPATIGLVLSASPLALLAWVGEKYLEWVDPRKPLPLETILEMASLYWLTATFPRSIYPYCDLLKGLKHTSVPVSTETPLGYSHFSHELIFLPKAWAGKAYPNLKFFRSHENGGHFAALEQPEVFLQDVEDFLESVQITSQTSG